ncbi:kinesin KIF6 isoform X2 [Pelobates cultripes]|uniref:Kinesin KIF6 isoform X2 n=1 Tax=Pelobates cultripes TaxID=61616 RepID=A0AAD1RIG2_PELCU|nr:kinesin KIF6 isoform X2 [Pelobates cultripes]
MEKSKVKLQKDFQEWWSEEEANLQNTQSFPTVNKMASLKSVLGLPLHSSTSDNVNSPNRSYRSSVTEPVSFQRNSQNASTSIPLTGDSQTDADILAFVRARQNIMQRKGTGTQ